MKWLLSFVSVLALTTAMWADPGSLRLDSATAAAKDLADKHDFRGAAAIFDPLAADVAITAQTGWPDAQLDRARYLAQSGEPEKAMAALTEAINLGATITAGGLADDKAFTALRERSAFKALTAKIERRARLWQDNPAIATSFKPVLSEEEKIAGLSKIWSEARFNFAFFERLPDLDWDAAYMEYLPKVRAAKTTEDYYRVLMRFIALLKDGHTQVMVPQELQDRFNGVTAVSTSLIEGKIIVTGVTDPALEALGIKTGAEVTTIEGQPALAYADTVVANNVFGFTPQDRAVWQYGYKLLRGPVSEPVHITVTDADGTRHAAAVPRIHNSGPFGVLPQMETARFKMLPGNIAYLEVTNVADDTSIRLFKENFAAASAADGLVIDFRQNGGGNDDYSHALVAMMADKPFYGSSFRTVDYKAAFRSWNLPIGWMRSPARLMQPDPDWHYKKPVTVLTSGRTYSAAEDFLVSFRSARRGTVIGETSGGSTGNPMLFHLPGGGSAFICTKDDAFADGTVFEGVGIPPDIEVKPTIADIRAGRDPVLDKAIEVIKAAR